MILTYHNIGKKQAETWVSVESFVRQMDEIANGKFQVVKFAEYDSENPKHIVLTFDDGRKNILNAVPVMKKHEFPFYVFVVGNLIGTSEEFLDESDFDKIRFNGGFLAWHTQTHPDLTTLSENQIKKELTNPYGLDILAYPYWKHNRKIMDIAKKLGYRYARSGNGLSAGGGN